MPLPSRSATNTKTSEATKVDLEKGDQLSPTASGSDEKKQQQQHSNGHDAIDDDPTTAPQECTIEEALAGAHLYPFKAVLSALGTDAEAGLHTGEIKKRQVSRE